MMAERPVVEDHDAAVVQLARAVSLGYRRAVQMPEDLARPARDDDDGQDTAQ